MKSLFGSSLALGILIAVAGCAALVWYLSATSHFSRRSGDGNASRPDGPAPAWRAVR